MLLFPAGAISTFSELSPQAQAITELAWTTIWILTAIFLVVFGSIGYILVRFREKPGEPPPRPNHGNTRLEIAWTVIPFLIVLYLSYLNVEVMYDSNPIPAANEEPGLRVVGHQWWWEVRYPNGVVGANEIHLPVGRKTLVRLWSEDVIHDFWVPDLGPKMDVVPGEDRPDRSTAVHLEPRQAGVYEGVCAEFCGNSHAWMRFQVIVHTPEEYEAWLAAEAAKPPAPTSAQALEGERLFQQLACLSCHASEGLEGQPDFAPDLTGVSRRAKLGGGVLPNSPQNLRAWLKDPQVYKPGCYMPDFNLTDEQLDALVAYLWRTNP